MLNFNSITDLKISNNAVAKVYLKSADGATKTLLWTRDTIPLSVPTYPPYKDNIFYNLATSTTELDLDTYIKENIVPNQYVGTGFELKADPDHSEESKLFYSRSDLENLYTTYKGHYEDTLACILSQILLSLRSGYAWNDGSGNLYNGNETVSTQIYICSLDNISTTSVNIDSPVNNTFTIADALVDNVSLYYFLKQFLLNTPIPESGGLWFQLEIPQNSYFESTTYNIVPAYQPNRNDGYIFDDEGRFPQLYIEGSDNTLRDVYDYEFPLLQIVKYPDTTNEIVNQPFVVKAIYTDAENNNTEIASMIVPLKFNISCKINSSIVDNSNIEVTRDSSNLYHAELSISDSFVAELESWGVDMVDSTIASGVTLSYSEDMPLFGKAEPIIDWTTRKLTLPIVTNPENWGTGTTTISFAYARPEGVSETPARIVTSQTLTVHIPSTDNEPTPSYSLETSAGWTISSSTASASMVWNTGAIPENIDAHVVPLDDSAISYSASVQNNVVTITNNMPSVKQRIQVIVQAIDPNGAYHSYTYIFEGVF